MNEHDYKLLGFIDTRGYVTRMLMLTRGDLCNNEKGRNSNQKERALCYISNTVFWGSFLNVCGY